VSDALARLLAEREQLEQGLSATLVLSLSGHLLLAGAAVVLPMLLPHEPPLRVADGVLVVLPRGGGGIPAAPAPPAAAPEAAPKPAEAAAPPPVVLKPPPKVAPPRDALPLPTARSSRRATPPPATLPKAPSASAASRTTPGAVASARGAASSTPGLEFGPPGPGVPGGSDSGGDWYLAGVQQKIWMTWNQQIKAGFTQSVGVTFTILPDGSVTGVRVTQPSGASLLDMAAQRAILNAAPFGPLPRDYGQKPRTIEAIFKPTQ
jgi:protein TonB